jgi:hypothetical protein
MGRRWLLLVSLLFVVGQQPAFACSCAQAAKPQLALRAAVIFTGVPTRFVRSFGFSGRGCGIASADPVTFSFDVQSVYKGDVPRRVDVNTVVSGASCGYEFQTGKVYTVFASPREDRLETNLCGGTVEGAITAADYGLPDGKAPRQ